jgi:hypothetical protein
LDCQYRNRLYEYPIDFQEFFDYLLKIKIEIKLSKYYSGYCHIIVSSRLLRTNVSVQFVKETDRRQKRRMCYLSIKKELGDEDKRQIKKNEIERIIS